MTTGGRASVECPSLLLPVLLVDPAAVRAKATDMVSLASDAPPHLVRAPWLRFPPHPVVTHSLIKLPRWRAPRGDHAEDDVDVTIGERR